MSRILSKETKENVEVFLKEQQSLKDKREDREHNIAHGLSAVGTLFFVAAFFVGSVVDVKNLVGHVYVKKWNGIIPEFKSYLPQEFAGQISSIRLGEDSERTWGPDRCEIDLRNSDGNKKTIVYLREEAKEICDAIAHEPKGSSAPSLTVANGEGTDPTQDKYYIPNQGQVVGGVGLKSKTLNILQLKF